MFTIVCLITAFIDTLFGFIVYFTNPGRRLYQVWLAFSLCTGMWLTGFGLMAGATSPASAYYWLKWFHYGFGAIFLPVLYFHFTLALLGETRVHRKLLVGNYVISAVFFIFNLFDQFVAAVPKPPFNFYTDPKPAYWFYAVWFTVAISSALVMLFIAGRHAKGLRRAQIMYQILATIVGFGGSSTSFFYVFNIHIYPVGVLWNCAYAIIMSYAIVRYQLMSIRVAISSAGIFLGVYSLTLGVPMLLYARGNHLGALIVAIALATPAPLLYGRLKKQAEDRILSAERADQEVLLSASKGLNKHKTVDEIVKFISYIFSGILKVKSLGFYLSDGDALVLHEGSLNGGAFPKEISAGHPLMKFFKMFSQPQNMEEFRQSKSVLGAPEITELIGRIPAQLAVPIVRGEKLIGLVFLGEKERELPYSRRDMEVIGLISDQVALAVENAGYLEMTKKDFVQVMHDRRLKDIGILGSTISHQMCNRLQRVTLGVGMFKVNFSEQALANDSREQLVAKLRETHEDMKVIERNAVSAAEISDALKTFSKPGVSPSAVAFGRLIKIARDLVDAKHHQFAYDFIADYSDELKLYVNEPSMQDVFFNAFDNGLDAIKSKMRSSGFKPEGFSPRLRVKARAQDGVAHIEVEDNGMGFKPEDQEKMFIPFFTTKGSDKGTGLGLHAMRELVRRNGGAIDISSEYLKGVKVIITLPLALDKEKAGV
ncbi:MAG: ATP-binding protein [Candidatus Omnitrophota bacterium]